MRPPRVPHVFGWEHLLFLAIFFAIAIPLLALAARKLKDEKKQDIVVKCVGGLLLVCITIARIGHAVNMHNWMRFIPDSICSVMSFALGFSAIFAKRDHIVFHYLCYVAFLGGAVNFIYPYYVSDIPNFLHPSTLFGLIHHSVAFCLSILMVITGYFKPSSKKFYAYPLGIVFSIFYGAFLIDALGIGNFPELGFTTAMNIFMPLVPGVFLFSWYLAFPVIAAAIYASIRLYEYLLKRHCAKKLSLQEANPRK